MSSPFCPGETMRGSEWIQAEMETYKFMYSASEVAK